MTSTPKKEHLYPAGVDEASEQVTLNDPLLSSIDDLDDLNDLTERQLDSLGSGDGRDDATRTNAKSDASDGETTARELSNDLSLPKKTVQQRRGGDGGGPDAAAHVKRNLFELPVSPKLKNRVRERLYTLVNSIEGYEGHVYLKDDETAGHVRAVDSFSKVLEVKSPKNAKNGVGVFSKMSGYECSGSRQHFLRDVSSASGVSGYGCALSGIVASQLHSLQQHREQLNQEKISLAVQQKEQESHVRVSFYREKMQQLIQVVEELEVRCMRSEAAVREEAKRSNDRTREREERHQEELAALRGDCRRKVEEAKAEARAVQAAADSTCEQRIQEVLSSAQVTSAALAKEHEARVCELQAVVSRLRAEKTVLEASLEKTTSEAGRAGSPLPQENDSLYEIPLRVDLPKRKFQEEAEFWKKESERLQKQLCKADVMQRKLVADKSQLKLSKMQVLQEKEKLQVQLKECAQHHQHSPQGVAREAAAAAAARAALAHQQEQTRQQQAALREHWQALVKQVQAHSRAQIGEYKKAVRCLKEQIKTMEKG